MTVAAAASPKATKRKRSATRAGSPWRRLWQVPLLLAGGAGFALGLRTLVRAIHPVPFAEQVEAVRRLLATDKFDQAIESINTLGDYYKTDAQQAELQVLAADTHYL